MKLPGHLLWHFQRISWIVLDWNSPPPPPPPLSLSWRTFAEVAKPSCPAPVADTTKMGVLMVFAKKKFEITFPRFTRQQKRCKRCKVQRQDAWSVSAGTITESKWSFWSLTIWHTNLSLTEKHISLNIRSHAFGLLRCMYNAYRLLFIHEINE